MKKNLWSFLAVILAAGAIVLQSYSSIPKEKMSTDQTAYDWYQVNSSNEIASTTPKYTDITKSSVISADPCKDQVLPNCLYGTNGTVTLGQNIASEPAEQRIRKQN